MVSSALMSITEFKEWDQDDPSDPFQFSVHQSFPHEYDLKEKKQKS